MEEFGRTFLMFGVVLLGVGLLFTFFGGQLPRLPGDIYIKRDDFSFYFPWVTSIIISIILTIILNLLFRR